MDALIITIRGHVILALHKTRGAPLPRLPAHDTLLQRGCIRAAKEPRVSTMVITRLANNTPRATGSEEEEHRFRHGMMMLSTATY